VRPTRAGNFALIALPFTLLAGYFIGGVTATAEMHQKQETYNVAYQWCAENTPDPTACQWGAYKVLNP
jgi:hypothetical protein